MSRWSFEDIHKIVSMYPKDTTSVLLQCVFIKPNFVIDNWDIEDCEFRLCRGSTLTEDIILFVSLHHDEMRIKIVELYYAKEDACAIIHIHLDIRTIINYYKEAGPTLAEFEKAGIEIKEFRKERIKF